MNFQVDDILTTKSNTNCKNYESKNRNFFSTRMERGVLTSTKKIAKADISNRLGNELPEL